MIEKTTLLLIFNFSDNNFTIFFAFPDMSKILIPQPLKGL
jgi:hypothetical protein